MSRGRSPERLRPCAPGPSLRPSLPNPRRSAVLETAHGLQPLEIMKTRTTLGRVRKPAAIAAGTALLLLGALPVLATTATARVDEPDGALALSPKPQPKPQPKPKPKPEPDPMPDPLPDPTPDPTPDPLPDPPPSPEPDPAPIPGPPT